MKIFTITLNPAYDVHACMDRFVPFHENLAQIQSKDAGGKGLNISRALLCAGVPHTAVIVLGKENSADYKQHLDSLRLDCLLFEKEGRIRENLTLHCPDSPETRISFSGFTVDRSILDEITAQLPADSDTVITFTGRVPQGIDMSDVKTFLQAFKARGAKIVLDSRSFSLADMYEVKPWLVKPNQEEISAFFDSEITTVAEAAAKARELHDHGIDNAMVSLGSEGALLCTGEHIYHALSPKIAPVSTIGAGDSTIAGFLAAASQGKTEAQCLRSAVAYGSAACLTSGSLPPRKQEAELLYGQVEVVQIH